MKNPFTTIVGIIGAIAYGITTVVQNGNFTPKDLIIAGFMAIVGYFAKDGKSKQDTNVPMIVLIFVSSFVVTVLMAATPTQTTTISGYNTLGNCCRYNVVQYARASADDTITLTHNRQNWFISVDTVKAGDTLTFRFSNNYNFQRLQNVVIQTNCFDTSSTASYIRLLPDSVFGVGNYIQSNSNTQKVRLLLDLKSDAVRWYHTNTFLF